MKKRLLILIIFALLATLFSSVFPVDLLNSVAGMRAAAAGKAGTAVYAGNNLYVMIWPYRGEYAFAVIDQAGGLSDMLQKMVNANGASVWKTADLVKWMETNGFTRIDPKLLPAGIGQALLGQYFAAVAAGSQALFTPLLVPAGALDLAVFQEAQL
ncbi:MAG TPA: hypothetical protein PKD23_06830 [Bellilinea sp.]|nr:hypothetical protein [Bellilinea sp.]